YRYSDNPFKEFHIYRELMDLFIVLGNYNFALNNDVSSKNNHPEWYYDKFHSIAKYIDEHYAEKLSLEEVASYAGFSMHHFSRIFKAYFGDSFSEHVMKQRVMHAVEILEHSNTSLLDTALASGFFSYSSFNRAFKQVMHCSPSNFRKMRNSSPLS
ncbi:MAG: AraC family transcriptional regulator, partial [Oscillospiraceae bacterium]|nr:AraC family transcriptional regulator [Oscillospiraceae bacterium]